MRNIIHLLLEIVMIIMLTELLFETVRNYSYLKLIIKLTEVVGNSKKPICHK